MSDEHFWVVEVAFDTKQEADTFVQKKTLGRPHRIFTVEKTLYVVVAITSLRNKTYHEFVDFLEAKEDYEEKKKLTRLYTDVDIVKMTVREWKDLQPEIARKRDAFLTYLAQTL